jgi:hypothetical protein
MSSDPHADVDPLRGQRGDQQDGPARQLQAATGRIRRARREASTLELVVSTTSAADAVYNVPMALLDEQSEAGTPGFLRIYF